MFGIVGVEFIFTSYTARVFSKKYEKSLFTKADSMVYYF